MTQEQFEIYKKKSEEIAPIKNFAFWCIERGYQSKLKQFGKHFYLKWRSPTDSYEEVRLPEELRTRIENVVLEYIREKEKELEQI